MEAQAKAEVLHGVIRKFGAGGKDITAEEWGRFVAAQNDDARTGPAVGERVPDFALPDQGGRIRTLTDLAGPNGLLLVFSRSADWWPYCRNQLVELQQSLPALRAAGLNAASVTYDSRETLAAFAEAYKIEFPLLSDAGSKTIRAFGILNTNIPEDHRMMYGIPFPGDYLIGADGVVRDKVFLPSYEHRPSASALAMRSADGAAGANAVEIETDALSATVALSAARCFPGQELASALRIRLKPGWHVYGKPLAPGYRATELVFEGPLVDEQAIELPAARPMLLKALGETLPVYEGEVRAVGKLGIKWSPPMPAKFLEPFGTTIAPGHYRIAGRLRFQPCSDTVCEPPQEIRFELPLELEAGVPPAPKRPA